MKVIEIKTLTQSAFAPYGTILRLSQDDGSGRYFEVLEQAHSTGWRIGIMSVDRYVAPYLERHLKSKESHEPLSGVMVLLVAPADDPQAEVKVTENINMPSSESETWKLPECITAKVEL